jgi:phosphatidylinositol alpha-1,6-mannosyltransferase
LVLRVGILTERIAPGDGWGSYAAGLTLGLQRLGVELVLIAAQAQASGGPVGIVPHVMLPAPVGRRLGTLRSLALAERLRQRLRSCDLIHCLVEPYLPLAAASRLPGQPLVATAHGTWAVRPLQRWPASLLYRWAWSSADLVVCQSQHTCRRLAAKVQLKRQAAIPGGVELAQWSGSGESGGGAGSGHPLVLTVGSSKARKGLEEAVRAVAIAARQFPGIQHVVVGRISQRDQDKLQAVAEQVGAVNRVAFRSQLSADELADLYRRAAVNLLLPIDSQGSFEGLGLTYLEAAAAGTPSIATTGSGAEEAVIDGRTGVLVPPHDPARAAEAILRLVGDENLRSEMGRAASDHAQAFGWDRVAARLLAEYQLLLAARPRTRTAAGT